MTPRPKKVLRWIDFLDPKFKHFHHATELNWKYDSSVMIWLISTHFFIPPCPLAPHDFLFWILRCAIILALQCVGNRQVLFHVKWRSLFTVVSCRIWKPHYARLKDGNMSAAAVNTFRSLVQWDQVERNWWNIQNYSWLRGFWGGAPHHSCLLKSIMFDRFNQEPL